MSPAITGVRRSSSEANINHHKKPSSASSLYLNSSKSDSFPDLTLASDTSTASSKNQQQHLSVFGEIIGSAATTMAGTTASTTSAAAKALGPSVEFSASLSPDVSVDVPSVSPTTASSNSKDNPLGGGPLGESWRSSSSDQAANINKSQRTASSSRRGQIRRAASVPGGLTSVNLPLPPPASLGEFLNESRHKDPLLLNAQNDDDAEDSTIEESWRSNPDKRRTLLAAAEQAAAEQAAAEQAADMNMRSDTMDNMNLTDTPLSDRSSLDNFLDDLIFDAKKTKWYDTSPGANYRKRRQYRSAKSSTQSLGGVLERGRPRLEKPGISQSGGDATVSGETSSSVPSSQVSRGRRPSSRTRRHHSIGPGVPTVPGDATSVQSGRSSQGRVQSGRSSQGRSRSSSFGSSTNPSSAYGDSRSETGPNKPKAPPIAWSHKSQQRPRSGSDSFLTPYHQERKQNLQSFNEDSRSSCILSAFLDKKSKHRQPGEAHTVSGDSRANSDTVSIAMSDTGGKTKTYQIGHREAQIIKSILQSSEETSTHSPTKSSVKGWLDKAAATMLSSSGHDATIITQASDIAESDRISTRSSMLVELSPLLGGKSHLKDFLDRRRSRDRRKTSAFTVAGDRVSVRFQGRSTQELLELIESEKRQLAAIRGGPPLVTGIERASSESVSAAAHPRSSSSLERVSSNPDFSSFNAMHMSMPLLFRGQQQDFMDEADDVQDSARIMDRTSSGDRRVLTSSREDLQSYLDGRLPKSRRQLSGSFSIAGERVPEPLRLASNKRRSAVASSTKQKGKSSTGPVTPRTSRAMLTSKLGDSMTSKDLDLEDFRPPTSARPTNRRSMMRKMQSVPILSDTNLNPAPLGKMPRTPRRQLSSQSESRRSRSDERRSRSGDRRRNRNNSTGSKERKASRKGMKKSSIKATERELTVDDLARKSFLDKLLDGEVDAHDSASQLHLNRSRPSMTKKEYKATLIDAPIENDSNKLRIEADFLEASQRLILQDPAKPNRRDGMKKMNSVPTLGSPSPALKDLYEVLSPKPEARSGNSNRRDGMKKMNSVPTLGSPSPALKDLYEVPSPKPEARSGKPEGDSAGVGSPKTRRKSPKKGKKGGKKKPGTGQKKKKTPPKVKEERSKKVEAVVVASGESPAVDKVTLKDLPRFRVDKNEDIKKQKLLARPNRLRKNQSMSSLDRRSYDVADRMLLVERLKALTNNAPPSPATNAIRKESPLRKRGPATPSSRKSKSSKQSAPLTTKSAPARSLLGPNAGRWKSVPRSLGSGLMAHDDEVVKPIERSDLLTPYSRKSHGSKKQEMPLVPYGSSTNTSEQGRSAATGEAEQDELGDGIDITSPPSKPLRKMSKVPTQMTAAKMKQSSRRSSTPTKLNLPISPRKKATLLHPVAIGEGSVLELDDNDSVSSDITDGFSLESWEKEYKKPVKRKYDPNLGKITESEPLKTSEHGKSAAGTSWAELSHSNKSQSDNNSGKSSIDRRKHLSKRWQSTPNMDTKGADMLKSPMREVEPQKKEKSKGFGWLKKLVKR